MVEETSVSGPRPTTTLRGTRGTRRARMGVAFQRVYQKVALAPSLANAGRQPKIGWGSWLDPQCRDRRGNRTWETWNRSNCLVFLEMSKRPKAELFIFLEQKKPPPAGQISKISGRDDPAKALSKDRSRQSRQNACPHQEKEKLAKSLAPPKTHGSWNDNDGRR